MIAVTPERFADDAWGNAPLLTRSEELEQGFADLFSLEAADEILSTRGLRTPFIRVAKDGAIVDSSRFTGPGGVGASVGDQVIDDRILDLFASGHTLVLQALHRFWPPIVAFAGTLGSELGHPVQVNAYITPKQAQGFAAHYDVHDVFVLQIAGSKRWVVHEPVHRDPLRNQPWTQHRAAVEERASEIPRDEYTLVAGDVLYLPRGFVHSAESLGDVSAHLTIGIHSHTRNDLVHSLLELAADDVRLRQTLPLGVDVGEPDHLAADLAATVEALCERIRSIPARDVAGVMERRSRAHGRPAPIAPLAQARALHGLDSSTLVSVRLQQSPTVLVTGGSATVRYVGGSLVFSSAANEALIAVLESSDGIRVGDIPGQSIEERLDLVRRLMRAGVVIADEPIIRTNT